jgi:hypothetical protein
MGKRLTALFVSLGERAKGDEEKERVEERAASKKRKSREVREEEEDGQHGLHDEMEVVDTSFGGADADLPDFDDAQVIACVGVCGCVWVCRMRSVHVVRQAASAYTRTRAH